MPSPAYSSKVFSPLADEHSGQTRGYKRSRRAEARQTPRLSRLQVLSGALAGLSLIWGLFNFGSTETDTLYRLFLLLSLPVLAICLALPSRVLTNNRVRSVVLLGLFLLAQVCLKETLEAQGYVVLSLGWAVFFIALIFTSQSPRAVHLAWGFLILLGVIEAIYGIVQSLAGFDYIGSYYRGAGRTATGTLINKNHFAGLLNMTLPLALGTVLTRIGSRNSRNSEAFARLWIMLLVCSFMGLAVLLSASRAGAAVLLATLAFVAVMFHLRRRGFQGHSLSKLVVATLILMIVGLGGWVGVDTLVSGFQNVDADLGLRLPAYRDSLDLIADYRFLGVGPGMYEWRFRPYQQENYRALYDHAHNDYLQTAAEWGIPAALLFWGFVVWRLSGALKVFFNSSHLLKQGLALGCAAAIFSILLHSFVDFNLQIPINLMIFCAILGLSWNLDTAFH